MATLAEIKRVLGVEVLALNTPKDANGNIRIDNKTNAPTKWMRHWDNASRTAVSVHADTVAIIKANGPEAQHLVLQGPEVVAAESGQEYTRYRIVAVTPAEVTL